MNKVGELAFYTVEAVGKVGTVSGTIVAASAAEAIQREDTLIAQASAYPDAPITLDNGNTYSGHAILTPLKQAMDFHQAIGKAGEILLEVGVAALAFTNVFTAVGHLKRLGARRYAQRSLGR